MAKILAIALSLVFAVSVQAQVFAGEQGVATLKYFDGQVTADLTWLKPPTVSPKNQLKMDLKTSNGQPYELDASDLKAGLFMTEMPDMGTAQQKIVAIADSSGNPISGSFMINAMKISMGGKWTLSLTLPNPNGNGEVETQKFQFTVR